MNKQTGFTLIELIMVIVILGILAATALPKFVNLGSDARTAAVQALEGSMRSANSIIYAKAAVQNQAGATGSVTIPGANGGSPITVNYGFAGTAAALSSVMDTSPSITLSGNQFQYSGATTASSCGVTYTVPTSAVPVPGYATLTGGC